MALANETESKPVNAEAVPKMPKLENDMNQCWCELPAFNIKQRIFGTSGDASCGAACLELEANLRAARKNRAAPVAPRNLGGPTLPDGFREIIEFEKMPWQRAQDPNVKSTGQISPCNAGNTVKIGACAGPCIKINACVDGSDYFCIEGGVIRQTHRNFVQIGKHPSCRDFPSYVAGGGFYLEGKELSAEKSVRSGIGVLGCAELVKGRGVLTSEQGNILVNDDQSGAADDYEIKLCER